MGISSPTEDQVHPDMTRQHKYPLGVNMPATNYVTHAVTVRTQSKLLIYPGRYTRPHLKVNKCNSN